MKFFGIDLGWTTGASGLCCLVCEDSTLTKIELEQLVELDDILKWMGDRTTGYIVVPTPFGRRGEST